MSSPDRCTTRGWMSALLAWACLWCSVSQGEVYKWVDENGAVHYGDRPPSSQARRLDVERRGHAEEGRSPKVSQHEKLQKLLKSYEEEREERKKEAAEKQRKKDYAKRMCLTAKENLIRLRAGGTYDESGKLMTEEERSMRRVEMERVRRKWCNQ